MPASPDVAAVSQLRAAPGGRVRSCASRALRARPVAGSVEGCGKMRDRRHGAPMSDFIDRAGVPRANVGIILMRGEGEVFLGGRSDGRGWQFPQGGIASRSKRRKRRSTASFARRFGLQSDRRHGARAHRATG